MRDATMAVRLAIVVVTIGASASVASAHDPWSPQNPPAAAIQAGRGAARPPAVVSPERQADGRMTFRVHAPNATAIILNAGDLPPVTSTPPGATPVPQTPGSPGATLFVKGENGIWEYTTAAPVPPGAFRYVFMIDGVRTLDPVNTRTAESNTAMWSMFYVPGHRRRRRQGRAARCRRQDLLRLLRAEDDQADARVHAAGLRIGQPEVSRLLPAPRRRGHR